MLNYLQKINQKVCFICSANYSGSTLLGFILGSHQNCFYSGEFNKKDTNYSIIKRSCKFCGVNCPVWKDIIVTDCVDIYEQLSIKTQKTIVINSTKDISWVEEQIATLQKTSSRLYFIFLQRDGRAVINSRIGKYPQEDVKEVINTWKERISKIQELYHKFKGKKIKLHYENLATNTESVTRTLCDFLEIDYQPQMLQYYQHEHHPLGGNNGTQFLVAKAQNKDLQRLLLNIQECNRDYYQNRGLEINLDLRWRQEIDPNVERLFEEMAGKENEEFKWNM
ncbi:sulfotransferase [Nostoc sp. PA-18-2419]|uniref:sulfotransferase n=1 Tax=Nostoc sp. PA-18-2419 TaxID=2575443 RepID=UPI0011092784|nr:sulfotransferase [Nostoc sp. PA-18-2419]